MILSVLAAVFTFLIIWFIIPYSPLKSQFKKLNAQLLNSVFLSHTVFSEDFIGSKPLLLQHHFRQCGLINKPVMKSSYCVFKNTSFLLNDSKPMIKMTYEQANYATGFSRLAFINCRMFGILPFQGLDTGLNGKGGMKAVVGKLLTIFNSKGKEMDLSQLVTTLAEGIVCPSMLLDDDIIWEQMDENHLRATLTKFNLTVQGVFEFDESGFAIGFYSKDRYEENNGTFTRRDWKAECNHYIEKDGIKRPTSFQAKWVYSSYEKLYFNCNQVEINYIY